MSGLTDYVYRRDMAGRIPSSGMRLALRIASHLEGHSMLSLAEPVLASLQEGGDMSVHVSPMARAKDAFKKATRNGDWSRYARLMDLVLNKWGIFHFHADSDSILVFSYICLITRTAFVIDICHHDKNWKIEQRLIDIIVRNWPNDAIVREVGEGRAPLSEAELLEARKLGINMAVGVGGKSYLPASRGLMMDGGGYDSLTGILPVVYMAKRVDPAAPANEVVKSPHFMMVGVDPDDPRPPWVIAAEQAGRIAAQRQRDRDRYMAEAGIKVVVDAVRATLKSGKS
jgi:hypothetical protein